MSKNNTPRANKNKGTQAPATEQAPAAPAAPAAAKPATVVLRVVKQPATAYRTGSARALYWEAVQAHAGKPVAELAATVAKAPPSVPGRGKLAGQAEPLAGWLSWFKAQGLITIS